MAEKILECVLPEFLSSSAQATGQIELMVQLAGLRGFVGNPSSKEELVVEKTFSALVVNRRVDDKDPDDAEGETTLRMITRKPNGERNHHCICSTVTSP